jgi:iron complex transport system substrate-binding protein
MIRMLGGLVGCADRAETLAGTLHENLAAIGRSAGRLPRRPRVFFEEWHHPLISGIQWVEELIELAGGDPIFPALGREPLATRRIVDPALVRDAAPDAILASWCGKRVRKSIIAARPGWSEVPAVRDGHVYEIRSTYLLQPGPAALTEGARQIHAIVRRAVGLDVDPALAPEQPWDRGGSRP